MTRKPTVQKATLSRPRTPQSSHCCIFLSPIKIVHSDLRARQPFSAMLYHDGSSSLVFFAECLKIITDSDLQIQNYKTEVQLKPKLHQLWWISLWLGKLQLSVFLKIVWVFWLDPVVLPVVIAFEYIFVIVTLWSNHVLRVERKGNVNQPCQQSVFAPLGACIRIWCTAGAVEQWS